MAWFTGWRVSTRFSYNHLKLRVCSEPHCCMSINYSLREIKSTSSLCSRAWPVRPIQSTKLLPWQTSNTDAAAKKLWILQHGCFTRNKQSYTVSRWERSRWVSLINNPTLLLVSWCQIMSRKGFCFVFLQHDVMVKSTFWIQNVKHYCDSPSA